MNPTAPSPGKYRIILGKAWTTLLDTVRTKPALVTVFLELGTAVYPERCYQVFMELKPDSMARIHLSFIDIITESLVGFQESAIKAGTVVLESCHEL